MTITNEELMFQCNVYFDFSKRARLEVLRYCGRNVKATLNIREQIKLFGTPLKRGNITIICYSTGIVIFNDNTDEPNIGYSWHGLITPILKSLFECRGEN